MSTDSGDSDSNPSDQEVEDEENEDEVDDDDDIDEGNFLCSDSKTSIYTQLFLKIVIKL